MARRQRHHPDDRKRGEDGSAANPPREVGKPSPKGGDATDGATDKENDFPVAGDDQNFFA